MISIIVPVYNAEKWIGRCLDSLLDMDYKDYEVVIVNDGSVDKTRSILTKYASIDSRFKVFDKENGGSASARNFGLKVAAGDYISFVDADDVVNRLFLSVLSETALIYQADIVECGFSVVDMNEVIKFGPVNRNTKPRLISNIEKLEEFCSREKYLRTAVLWNKLYKKSLFDGLEFTEGKGIDDEFLIHRIIYNAKKIAILDEELYCYFLSDNSQMRSGVSLKELDKIEAVEAQMSFFKTINNEHLYNLLLYRYYRSVIEGYNLVYNYFPEEKDKLTQLRKKRKTFYKALFVKETTFAEKVFLIICRYMPRLANYLHHKRKKKI